MSERDKFPYVACLDLDRTIGNFDEDDPPVGLRHGIKEVLSKLAERGFKLYITTFGSEAHALNVLSKYNLTSLIDPSRVWPIDVTTPPLWGYGKTYGGIEEGAYFDDQTQEIYLHKMIAIGDQLADQPADRKYLVFIHNKDGYQYDADVLLQVVNCLLETGQDSLKNGFDTLFEQAELVAEKKAFQSEIIHQRKRYTLPSGLLVDLDYGDEAKPGDNDKSHPRITIINSEKYLRELD